MREIVSAVVPLLRTNIMNNLMKIIMFNTMARTDAVKAAKIFIQLCANEKYSVN